MWRHQSTVHNYRICIAVNRGLHGVTPQDSNLRSHSHQELLHRQPSLRPTPHFLLFSFPHYHVTDQRLRAGIAQSVHRLATGVCRSGDRFPVGGEISCTRPDRSWGTSGLLYNGYRVFPGGKAAGAWRWPPTPSRAEVKERVKLYLFSPFGPSWPVLGWTFTLSLTSALDYSSLSFFSLCLYVSPELSMFLHFLCFKIS